MNVGADAIVVSNHGGRQLDGALSSIKALPAIVDAVGDKAEVWMDSVSDRVRMCCVHCTGAQGTLIGRAFLYGLGANGKPG